MRIAKKLLIYITIIAIIVSLISLTILTKNFLKRETDDDIFGKSFDGIILFLFMLPFGYTLLMTLLSGYRYLKTLCTESKRWYFISYILSFIGILMYMFISIGVNLDDIIDFKSLFSSYNISYILEKVITVYSLVIAPLSMLLYVVARKISNSPTTND